MQLLLKTLSILAISFFNTSISYAETTNNGCETQINCIVQTGNTTVTTSTSTIADSVVGNRAASGQTTTTTQTTNTSTNSSNFGSMDGGLAGIYEQAQQAQNMAMATVAAGTVLAAVGLPQCPRPGGQAACMMGVAGLVAAGLGAMAAGQAGALKDQLGGSETADPTTTTTTDKATTTDSPTAIQAKVDKLKADYAKAGYKINPDGSVTLPNGKTVDSDMNAASLKAAGFSDADINKIMAGNDKLKNKNGVGGDGNMSVASADRGNGMMPGAVGSGPGTAGAGSAIESANVNRDPAAWNGFYKQFGDSVIGVSQSDIFLLIEKRVEQERKVMGQ
jgi:hypothetical protein